MYVSSVFNPSTAVVPKSEYPVSSPLISPIGVPPPTTEAGENKTWFKLPDTFPVPKVLPSIAAAFKNDTESQFAASAAVL